MASFPQLISYVNAFSLTPARKPKEIMGTLLIIDT